MMAEEKEDIRDSIQSDNADLDKPDEEYYFGIWKFRPKWLQKIFRNSYFFTFLMCCNVTIEGALASGMC